MYNKCVSGSAYYRLSRTYTSPNVLRMDRGYPRSLRIWNLPVTSVDAALNFGGRNYFMEGENIYLYDNTNIQVTIYVVVLVGYRF